MSNDDDDDELHPLYDVTARIDALYSVPAYRSPPLASMERWRDFGERLLEYGEPWLQRGEQAVEAILAEAYAARRRRRRTRGPFARHRRRLIATPAPRIVEEPPPAPLPAPSAE